MKSLQALYLSVPEEAAIIVQSGTEEPQGGRQLLRPATESLSYDNRGNLTSDSLWDYGWDAQNRLIWVQSRSWAASPRRLDMVYDGLGRRIQRVFKLAGVVQQNTIYVYDGWLLLAELDGLNSNALVRSYGWGLDLSGMLQGAGRIGGLLWVQEAGSVFHFPMMDGTGNVLGLVSGADGTVTARYEYGPFGEVVRQTGDMAKANPFRFSTKYTDEETELAYYGYRYYSPTLGRWLSRDPIEEEGGLNLYGFVGNNPVNFFDYCGLTVITGEKPLEDPNAKEITPSWAWANTDSDINYDFTLEDCGCEGKRIVGVMVYLKTIITKLESKSWNATVGKHGATIKQHEGHHATIDLNAAIALDKALTKFMGKCRSKKCMESTISYADQAVACYDAERLYKSAIYDVNDYAVRAWAETRRQDAVGFKESKRYATEKLNEAERQMKQDCDE